MIPLGTDIPQRRVPWMNILLIFSNVIVYFVSRGNDVGGSSLAKEWYPFMLNVPVGGDHAWALRWMQFLTYQFLHANFMHLAGNMVFLYVFGNNLNEKLGHVGYLAFYLAGGVLAGCGQLLTSASPTLGASGSISAVTGLYFVLLPRTHVRLLLWYFFYVNVIEIPSMWLIAFCFVKDLAEPLFLKDNSVAHFAHLAGSLTGFAVGLLLLGAHLVQRDHYDLGAMINRWRRRREYLAVVSQGYDPYMHGRNPSTMKEAPARVGAQNAKPADTRVEFMRDLIFSMVRQHDMKGAAAKYQELLNLDANQVLPPEMQIDVANQYYSDANYRAAANAYEAYLKTFPTHDAADQIRLLLGVLYVHAYPNGERATELLTTVLPRLRDPAQRQLAEADLAHLAAQKG